MEKFKGNATYFERKSGSLEEIVSKINEANPKPEVFDLQKESEEYKAVFQAAMKKFKINSPADLKSDEEETQVKKSVRETVQDLLLKSWKQAAQMAENNVKEYVEADGTKRRVKEGDMRRKENKDITEEEKIEETSISVNDISYSDMPKSKLSQATRKFKIKMKKLPKNKVYPG